MQHVEIGAKISNGSLGRALKKRTKFGADKLVRLLQSEKFDDLNLYWFFKDQGPMLLSEITSEDSTGYYKLKTIEELQEIILQKEKQFNLLVESLKNKDKQPR